MRKKEIKQQAQKVSVLSIIIGFIFLIYGERCLATPALLTSAISPQRSPDELAPRGTFSSTITHWFAWAGCVLQERDARLCVSSPSFLLSGGKRLPGRDMAGTAAGWSGGTTSTASLLGHLHTGEPGRAVLTEVTNNLQTASVPSDKPVLAKKTSTASAETLTTLMVHPEMSVLSWSQSSPTNFKQHLCFQTSPSFGKSPIDSFSRNRNHTDVHSELLPELTNKLHTASVPSNTSVLW